MAIKRKRLPDPEAVRIADTLRPYLIHPILPDIYLTVREDWIVPSHGYWRVFLEVSTEPESLSALHNKIARLETRLFQDGHKRLVLSLGPPIHVG